MRYVRTHGVILRVRNGRNADRMVIILTADHGKITAVARSCRNLKSKNCSLVSEHNHISCQLYFGRGLPILTQVKPLGGFLKEGTISQLALLSFIAETTDALLPEEQHVDNVLPLVLETYSLVNEKNFAVILPCFTVKLMTILGFVQPFSLCQACHTPLQKAKSQHLGDECSILCNTCAKSCDAVAPLSGVKLLHFVQEHDLSELFRVRDTMKLSSFLQKISAALFESVTHRRRKSEDFLLRSLA
jgi:DNA repair protein RecO (recombination protein O)